MGFFTSAPVTWRRGIRDHVDSRAEFNQLVNTIGRPDAKKFLETLYDKWVVRSGYKAADLTAKSAAQYMKGEREKYTARKFYVDSLLPRTKGGELGTILNDNLRPTQDYYKNPLRAGADGRDLAIDQAANWICGDYVAALPATRATLGRYIPRNPGDGGRMGQALGRTSKHLRDVWKRSVTLDAGATPYRISLQGATKYPSTVGGSALLEHIFGLTSGTNSWPAFGDAQWESIAMFYLISIVHVQGFADGNKRTGHLAYAIVMVKGMHSFKAPTGVKENELFKMNS